MLIFIHFDDEVSINYVQNYIDFYRYRLIYIYIFYSYSLSAISFNLTNFLKAKSILLLKTKLMCEDWR